MILRLLMLLLALSIALTLFFYVFTGKAVYLTRAWQIVGVGLVLGFLVWVLMALEYLS